MTKISKRRVNITSISHGRNLVVSGEILDETITNEELKRCYEEYTPFGVRLTRYSDGTFDLIIHKD